jgi:hypothetical protein
MHQPEHDPSKRTPVIANADELIGAIPYLIRVRPHRSLILLAGNASSSTNILSATTSLPTAEHALAAARELRLSLAHAIDHVWTHHGELIDTGSLIVVDDSNNPLPHRAFIDALTAELGDTGITIPHSLWTPIARPGEIWHCYDPCRCRGVTADMSTSTLAVQLTVDGITVADSRDQLAATLGPSQPERLAARAALIHKRQTDEPRDGDSVDAAIQAVDSAIAAASTQPDLPNLVDDQIADLAAALAQPRVRDHCLAVAISDQAEAAQRLWTTLARETPAPHRDVPLVLLGIDAYLRSNVTYANVAFELALDANPDNFLAGRLLKASHAGIPPTLLRQLLTEALDLPGR